MRPACCSYRTNFFGVSQTSDAAASLRREAWVFLNVTFHSLPQRLFFADLPHGPSEPVGIEGRRGTLRAFIQPSRSVPGEKPSQ